jgi:hypothetical protein
MVQPPRLEPTSPPVAPVAHEFARHARRTEAMQLMVEGDKWEMYLPSNLACMAAGICTRDPLSSRAPLKHWCSSPTPDRRRQWPCPGLPGVHDGDHQDQRRYDAKGRVKRVRERQCSVRAPPSVRIRTPAVSEAQAARVLLDCRLGRAFEGLRARSNSTHLLLLCRGLRGHRVKPSATPNL